MARKGKKQKLWEKSQRYKYTASLVIKHRQGFTSTQIVPGEFLTMNRLLNAVRKTVNVQNQSMDIASWTVTINKIDRYHEGE